MGVIFEISYAQYTTQYLRSLGVFCKNLQLWAPPPAKYLLACCHALQHNRNSETCRVRQVSVILIRVAIFMASLQSKRNLSVEIPVENSPYCKLCLLVESWKKTQLSCPCNFIHFLNVFPKSLLLSALICTTIQLFSDLTPHPFSLKHCFTLCYYLSVKLHTLTSLNSCFWLEL